MNSRSTTLLAALIAVRLAQVARADDTEAFSALNLSPDYRPTFVLPGKETSRETFNGFMRPDDHNRIVTSDLATRPTGPSLPTVLSRVGELGLTGVIPSTLTHKGVIVLGGQVYREGQELTLFDSQSHRTISIVPDHKIVLRSVTLQAIGLEVSLIGMKNVEQLPIELAEFRQR